jgi:hypothetical protein
MFSVNDPGSDNDFDYGMHYDSDGDTKSPGRTDSYESTPFSAKELIEMRIESLTNSIAEIDRQLERIDGLICLYLFEESCLIAAQPDKSDWMFRLLQI